MGRHAKPVLVAAMAVVAVGAITLRVLAEANWDASVFAAFGEDADPTREYAEDRLGNVFLRAHQGHDGKFFFVQANDPWLLNPEENALVLDRPLYRSQRMLYPVLAGGLGFFGPDEIVWAMLMVNLIAIGMGTFVVSLIAREMGGSTWWGLAFALNIGFISEVLIGGAGVVAAVAAFAAVLFFVNGRTALGVALLVLAALAREAMLLAAAGTAWWLIREGRSRKAAASTFLAPIGAVGIWAGYLRLRITSAGLGSEVQEIGWPFVGFVEAFSDWLGEPVNLAAGMAIMLLFVLYTRRTLLSRQLIGWAFLGFVGLGILFTEQVWLSYFDITRAVAPLITSFVLLVFAAPKARSISGAPRVEVSSEPTVD